MDHGTRFHGNQCLSPFILLVVDLFQTLLRVCCRLNHPLQNVRWPTSRVCGQIVNPLIAGSNLPANTTHCVVLIFFFFFKNTFKLDVIYLYTCPGIGIRF